MGPGHPRRSGPRPVGAGPLAGSCQGHSTPMSEHSAAQTSYWIETAPGLPRPALAEDVTVDVAVVGGGVAGLSTAWEVAHGGRSVAVLEAGRLARGVTGHTTA